MTATETEVGELARIAGLLVVSKGLTMARLHDVVNVGHARLPGEVIRLDGGHAYIQVYEETAGLMVGEPVEGTGAPLEVELGPGLLGSIFDGIQRPLQALARHGEDPVGRPMLERGAYPPSLDRERTWDFTAAVEEGASVGPGDVLGRVPETDALEHRILVPPGVAGEVAALRSGPMRVDEPVALVGGTPVAMLQRWPIRTARPFTRRLPADTPLVTGQRVIDSLFPVALGGTAAIPGGFGTGKTVLETSLAKHAHVDVVVYVGCGERGNELTEVLEEFPRLEDPRTGAPLMQRTVLVANTSNMPVAAREASIYTGLTIAEYFRDQGLHVALMADSTSRWAEALREVSGRLEEMPAEEGYPAYLPARLAAFYERAGAVEGLSGERGSVTIVGAVSPAGGDFSEPVTQQTLRVAGTFWALDTELARQRHFPAIDWSRSYTLYELDDWFDTEVAADFSGLRSWALALLGEEGSLLEIVQLLGTEALAPAQRVVLRTGRLLRENVLRQSAFDADDASSPLETQRAMLWLCRRAHAAMDAAVTAGASPEEVGSVGALHEATRMRTWTADEADARADALAARIEEEVASL